MNDPLDQLSRKITQSLLAMPSCASCKHWGVEPYAMYVDPPRRYCPVLDARVDAKDVERRARNPVEHCDSSEGFSYVATLPDFGCKAWEPHG